MNRHIELLRESVGVLARNGRFVALYLVTSATIPVLFALRDNRILYGLSAVVLLIFALYVMSGLLGCMCLGIEYEIETSYKDFKRCGKAYFFRVLEIHIITGLIFILPTYGIKALHKAMAAGSGSVLALYYVLLVAAVAMKAAWTLSAVSQLIDRDIAAFEAIKSGIKVFKDYWARISVAALVGQVLAATLILGMVSGFSWQLYYTYIVITSLVSDAVGMIVYASLFVEISRNRQLSIPT